MTDFPAKLTEFLDANPHYKWITALIYCILRFRKICICIVVISVHLLFFLLFRFLKWRNQPVWIHPHSYCWSVIYSSCNRTIYWMNFLTTSHSCEKDLYDCKPLSAFHVALWCMQIGAWMWRYHSCVERLPKIMTIRGSSLWIVLCISMPCFLVYILLSVLWVFPSDFSLCLLDCFTAAGAYCVVLWALLKPTSFFVFSCPREGMFFFYFYTFAVVYWLMEIEMNSI